MPYRRRHLEAVFFGIALLVGLLSACARTLTPPTSDITRERAIEIARAQANFEPSSIDARTDVRRDTPVWIVTLRAADGSHGGLGQFMEVTLSRSTGSVL